MKIINNYHCNYKTLTINKIQNSCQKLNVIRKISMGGSI
jgi:hypothetical protein